MSIYIVVTVKTCDRRGCPHLRGGVKLRYHTANYETLLPHKRICQLQIPASWRGPVYERHVLRRGEQF